MTDDADLIGQHPFTPSSLIKELRTRTTIHAEMVRRLIDEAQDAPSELAEVLEDVANAYLDMMEEIAAMRMSRRITWGH